VFDKIGLSFLNKAANYHSCLQSKGRSTFSDCIHKTAAEIAVPVMQTPVNMPELNRYWAYAASIGPVPARFWHITVCLQGHTYTVESICIDIMYNNDNDKHPKIISYLQIKQTEITLYRNWTKCMKSTP